MWVWAVRFVPDWLKRGRTIGFSPVLFGGLPNFFMGSYNHFESR
jgi:hypothetical protein